MPGAMVKSKLPPARASITGGIGNCSVNLLRREDWAMTDAPLPVREIGSNKIAPTALAPTTLRKLRLPIPSLMPLSMRLCLLCEPAHGVRLHGVSPLIDEDAGTFGITVSICCLLYTSDA